MMKRCCRGAGRSQGDRHVRSHPQTDGEARDPPFVRDFPRAPGILAAGLRSDCGGTCERIDAYPIISPNPFFLAKEIGMATTVHIIEFSDYL